MGAWRMGNYRYRTAFFNDRIALLSLFIYHDVVIRGLFKIHSLLDFPASRQKKYPLFAGKNHVHIQIRIIVDMPDHNFFPEGFYHKKIIPHFADVGKKVIENGKIADVDKCIKRFALTHNRSKISHVEAWIHQK